MFAKMQASAGALDSLSPCRFTAFSCAISRCVVVQVGALHCADCELGFYSQRKGGRASQFPFSFVRQAHTPGLMREALLQPK